jgi:hypothetical protein
MPEDKIQREIEDILNRLDTFLPEESVATRVRKRSSGAASTLLRSVLDPLLSISLRQVILASFALILAGFLIRYSYPDAGRWVLIAGVVLLLGSFVVSFFSRSGGRSGSSGPAPEKRWRGQPMVLQSPSLGDRLRTWFRAKGRRH